MHRDWGRSPGPTEELRFCLLLSVSPERQPGPRLAHCRRPAPGPPCALGRTAGRTDSARSGGGRARAPPRSRARAAGIKQAAEPERVLISGRQLLGITLTEWFCLPAFSTVRRPRAMDQRRGGGSGGRAQGGEGGRADPARSLAAPPPAPAQTQHPLSQPGTAPSPRPETHPFPPRVVSLQGPSERGGWERRNRGLGERGAGDTGE